MRLGLDLSLSSVMRGPSGPPPPELLSAPTISGFSEDNPVVGETAIVADAATWAEEPVSRSYSFYRGATLAASDVETYTLIDADAAMATRGVITIRERAVFANGAVGYATSAATNMPRRTFANAAWSIGALTKGGWASVPLTNRSLRLLARGAATPASMTVLPATAGTASHWTLTAGMTPKPSTAGDTANLSSGTYSFPVTTTWLDGLPDESSTIVITAAADTASIGPADNWNAIGTTYVTELSGKTIEVVAGAEFAAGARMACQGWRFAAMTYFRYADSDRIVTPAALSWNSCTNMTVDDVWIADGSPTGVSARFALGLYNSLGTNSNMVLNNLRYHGSAANAGTTAHFGLSVSNCDSSVVVNDLDVTYVATGLVLSADLDNPTINNPSIGHFFDNGVQVIASEANAEINDLLLYHPFRAFSGTHIDGMQFNNGVKGPGTIKLRRMMMILGSAGTGWQGFFGPEGSAVASDASDAYTPEIDGFIYMGAAANGCGIAAGQNCVFDHVGLFAVNTDLMPHDPADNISSNAGLSTKLPKIYADPTSTKWGGTNIVRNSIAHGEIVLPGSWTGTNNVQLNGTIATPGDYSSYYDALNEVALRALCTATDAMEPAAVRAAVLALLTPKAGVTAGPVTPEGDWAQAA